MVSTEHTDGGIGKYLVTYVCILAIAGIQFVVAYQNIDTGKMLTRMLILAFVDKFEMRRRSPSGTEVTLIKYRSSE